MVHPLWPVVPYLIGMALILSDDKTLKFATAILSKPGAKKVAKWETWRNNKCDLLENYTLIKSWLKEGEARRWGEPLVNKIGTTRHKRKQSTPRCVKTSSYKTGEWKAVGSWPAGPVNGTLATDEKPCASGLLKVSGTFHNGNLCMSPRGWVLFWGAGIEDKQDTPSLCHDFFLSIDEILLVLQTFFYGSSMQLTKWNQWLKTASETEHLWFPLTSFLARTCW